ncbi:MAG: tetratricopeptide repeat protein [Elusimicrobia bacterium]|nr:tetratricopeptide repeat protein [Elusimicrobiota bacterium]
MRVLILAVLAALAGCASRGGGGEPESPGEPLPELSLQDARAAFVELSQAADVHWQYAFAKVQGVNLSRDGGSVAFKLAYVDDKEKGYRPEGCRVEFRGLTSIRIDSVGGVVGAGKPRRWVRMDPQPCDLMWFFDQNDLPKARKFAAAVSRLATSTKEEIDADRKKEDEAFEEAVREHEKDPRRELTDRLRRIELAARKARQTGDTEKAIRAYSRILEDSPWWPDGWRELADILAELGRFDAAANAMKRYLRLEPRGRDAKQAREKIAQWEKGR